MTAAQTKENEDYARAVNIPGYISVGGRWCRCKFFFVFMLIMLEHRAYARAAKAIWRGKITWKK